MHALFGREGQQLTAARITHSRQQLLLRGASSKLIQSAARIRKMTGYGMSRRRRRGALAKGKQRRNDKSRRNGQRCASTEDQIA
jgi:hypothetical protein